MGRRFDRSVRWFVVVLGCVGVALSIRLVAPLATLTPSFSVAKNYGAGTATTSLAIADLNGDGKPDLATANADGADAASVLLNKGDGSFTAARDYPTGRMPDSVVIGDLNGDNKLDVATANFEQSSVSVLVNESGRCAVPDVTRKPLRLARPLITQEDCRVGTIRHAYSKTVKTGHVISQQPKPGTVLPNLGKVSLTTSRGPKPS
jgi:hypothetical protein